MRFPFVALLACIAVAGCSGQGFLTRSLGGTVVDLVPGAGPPVRSEAYSIPEPVAGEPLRRLDRCVDEARVRADDAKVQRFDETTQKQVYDATLADCRAWAARQ